MARVAGIAGGAGLVVLLLTAVWRVQAGSDLTTTVLRLRHLVREGDRPIANQGKPHTF